ncbi:MAG: 2-phospho-L-lactate guanylyltransferase [Caldilineaceae bacterium]|nr:2-phospho-L-lactate guanylyltransferase [Caldilineaceae bacterium]
MGFWLITPVKPFEEGKSRLAKVLSIAERTSLNQQLLTNLLTVVQRAGVCTGMIVVSQSRAALQLAAAHNAVPLLENKQKSYVDGLNPALEQARAAAMARGATVLLVLPADLPWIQPDDLWELYRAAQRQPGISIVPSRDNGTNALLLQPPDAIEFAFGPDSFARHEQLAAQAGLPCQTLHMPNLAIDIDQPADLALLADPTMRAYSSFT